MGCRPQINVPLNNGTNVPALVAALEKEALDEQFAVARLLSSLTMESFSQSKILEAGISCLLQITRLLRCAASLHTAQSSLF